MNLKILTGEQKIIFKESYTETKKNLLVFFRLNLAVFSSIVFANYIAALVAINLVYKRSWQEVFLAMLVIPTASYLISGYIHFFVARQRGVTVAVNKIFRGYRWYWNIFIYTVLLYAGYLVFIKVLFDGAEYRIVFIVRIFMGLAFAFWFFARTIFVPIIIIDKEESILSAIAESFYLTERRMLPVSSFILTAIILLICGLLFFAVGLLFVSPIIIISLISYYDLFRKNPPNPEEKLPRNLNTPQKWLKKKLHEKRTESKEN